MKISLATDAHIPEIIELWKEFIDFHKNIDPHFTRSPDGHLHFEKLVKDLIKAEDSLVLVAIEKGQIVAYSISKIGEYPPVFGHLRYGNITDLAVKTDYQRKGIGGKMLRRIFKWFESHNINRIELRVASGNQIGDSFWRKHGFKEFISLMYLNR
ncbi:MAG: GNAT family N-acetyltransferase [Candidatus Zixiibacteriota bacterium]